MLYNAKSGIIPIDGTEMEYIRFGTGSKKLVFLPGLGDGLRSVKGSALPMALLYRKYTADYTAYMFSRKKKIPQGCSTKDMAAELKKAMEKLGIEKADVIGVSMGGMVAQHLAADFPEAVDRLALVVTCPYCNPIAKSAIEEWMSLAKGNEHLALMDSNLKLIYSEKYYRRNRWMLPLGAALSKPKSYERFFRQAEACLSHDSRDSLSRIKAPTLIIGGAQDRVLGGEASKELHDKIPGSKLRIYPNGNHGLYDEEKDFNDIILRFFSEQNRS